MTDAYCDLRPLNTFFNNKPLYKCEYCGLTVGLENPDTKILCFKKMEDIVNTIHRVHTHSDDSTVTHLSSDSKLEDVVLEKITDDSKKQNEKNIQYNSTENICTDQQIEARLKICNTCEYYQNNSCLMCGCTVVREANYKNKLAHKDQKCPVDKWGPIVDQN